MRAALLALLLAACDNSWGYGATIKPVPDEPRWRAQVIAGAEAWNAALSTCDGPSLIVRSDGHPVELSDGEGLSPEISGRFNGDSVLVREGLGEWELPVLIHELGHALGFEHVSEECDPDSIMNPTIGKDDTITDGDVVRGLAYFGCH